MRTMHARAGPQVGHEEVNMNYTDDGTHQVGGRNTNGIGPRNHGTKAIGRGDS